MRIIAGTHRGRKLISVPMSKMVKPISDRIKQSLFDILRPKITASLFLDLYAGTGAVGMEALSRGAQKVVFAEKDPVCLKTINRNADKFGFGDKCRIVRADILKGLDIVFNYCGDDGYDIIFMGTPYRDDKNNPLSYTGITFANIDKAKILAKDGIIVAQHHIKEQFEIPGRFQKYREEKYGDTLVTFLKHL